MDRRRLTVLEDMAARPTRSCLASSLSRRAMSRQTTLTERVERDEQTAEATLCVQTRVRVHGAVKRFSSCPIYAVPDTPPL